MKIPASYIFLLLIITQLSCRGKQEVNSVFPPESLKYYQQLVDSSLYRGDTIKALVDLERILQVKTDEAAINRYRELCLSKQEIEREIGFFKKMVRVDKNKADFHFALGMAYIDKIQHSPGPEAGMLASSAIDEFKKTIAIDSLHWSALYALGMTYYHMPQDFNCDSEAIKILSKLLQIQEKTDTLRPEFVFTYITLGDLYKKVKEEDKATAVWQKGFSLFPDNDVLKKRLGIE